MQLDVYKIWEIAFLHFRGRNYEFTETLFRSPAMVATVIAEFISSNSLKHPEYWIPTPIQALTLESKCNVQ